MPKTGEEKPCPKCGGTMTWDDGAGTRPEGGGGQQLRNRAAQKIVEVRRLRIRRRIQTIA